MLLWLAIEISLSKTTPHLLIVEKTMQCATQQKINSYAVAGLIRISVKIF